MPKCQNYNKNLNICTCTYDPCSRKGICCECIAYHRNMGQIPGCLFSPSAEKIYDRSRECFVKYCK